MKNLKVKIYADGADVNSMLKEYDKGLVKGFTTNPSLMKKAGVKDYKSFGKEVVSKITDMPISFEVFADDEELMIKEAREIATWADNIYVKVPVVNTKGEFNKNAINVLAKENVKLNITAVFTINQVKDILESLEKDSHAIISIFAGRVADTGVDPMDLVKESVELAKEYKNVEILWASCRELYNIFQAENSGCHIITVQNSILDKLDNVGKDLTKYSVETVQDFFKDANSLGFSIL
ncbi:transaldolase [Romboutsia sp. 1001713B170207_170306_H8]|uniref:transaldolase n=1 Tax=Romboutsia sp. 1001713B170207_170306_H8 TaxID=2787112 RepID=UPI000820A289|nr:transaldolase [Romboutsia sp. 1001713B170207_170306_H8]SCH47461.1 Transaldolase [uncultured Clostridium sp.]